MTTKEDIRFWLETARKQGASHVIVVCDTFDHEDYPVYVTPPQDVHEVKERYDNNSMQRIMEVYLVAGDWEAQLGQPRSFNY